MMSLRHCYLALVLCVGFCSSSWAQDVFSKDAPKIQFNIQGLYEDNHIPLVEEDVAASGVAAKVNGQLVSDFDALWLQAKYAAELNRFSFDASAADIDDSFVSGQLDVTLRSYVSERWFVDVFTKLQSKDERLGQGISRFRPQIVDSDHYNKLDAGIRATYGSDISSRYIRLAYLHSDKDYDPNNSYSDEFDLQQQSLSVEFGVKIFGASRLLFVAEHQQDDYVSLLREDSDTSRVFIGFDWQASGKSSFSLLVGGYQRQLDFGEQQTGLSWRLSGIFEPSESWSIQLSSARESIAGDLETSLDTLQTIASLSVTRIFSEQWQASSFVSYQTTEYEIASAEVSSEDPQQSEVGLGVSLVQSSFSRYKLNVSSFRQENPARQIDFRQNQVNLSWLYDY